jgi:hypothetical protein
MRSFAMRLILIASVVATLAMLPAVQAGAPRVTEEERLQKLLLGKTPGKPQSCIPLNRSGGSEVIGGSIIFRENSRRLYRNEPRGGCDARRIGSGLIFRVTSSSLCRGDVAQIVDFSSGIHEGHCVLGDFVPYQAPPKS